MMTNETFTCDERGSPFPAHSREALNDQELETAGFYQRMIRALDAAGVPFLVGGAFALARYTGITRHTKDFDVFVRPIDAERTLRALSKAGCTVEHAFPHWLGKAYCNGDYIDVIYGSGNGIAEVDEEWFTHSVPEVVLGEAVRLVPPEELLWSKAFVMERERFDGADINHLLLHMAESVDWERLVCRFDDHAMVLFAHITLFRYAYPSEAHRIPNKVIEQLHAAADSPQAGLAEARVCRGTCLSREQYLVDIEEWGFRDGRRQPYGSMSPTDIAIWTEAIEEHP